MPSKAAELRPAKQIAYDLVVDRGDIPAPDGMDTFGADAPGD